MDHTTFLLRGPNYLNDSIKLPSGPPTYAFIGWEAFKVKKKFYNPTRFMTVPLPPRELARQISASI